MEYVPFGRSSLKVSRLSLGAMGFGDPSWRRWALDEDGARPIMRAALDAGINLIDTCDFYSSGISEQIVGSLIRNFIPRSEIVVATKAGNPMGKGPNARGYSRKHLFEAADASLKRLGVEVIDLYQTHIWDPSTNLEEMMDAFDGLVRAGKVLYVGATDIPVWQLARAQAYAARQGTVRFSCLQHHHNAIWREDERELVPYCAAEGIARLPYSPMGRGFLCGQVRRTDATSTARAETDDYAGKLYGRSNDHEVSAVIEGIAAETDAKPSQVALAWSLSRPGKPSVLFGATRPEHVADAVAAAAIQLTAAQCSAIEAAYQPRSFGGHGL